jgi:hypothetical protein
VDILVKKTTGFNVGIVADLQEYINLRFEPGLYYTKRPELSCSVQKEMLYEK